LEERHREKALSFILYVSTPHSKINAKQGTGGGVPACRKNIKSTIERMIVNFNSQKNNGTQNWFHSGYNSRNHDTIPKAKVFIT
jgi:hypothetical protein